MSSDFEDYYSGGCFPPEKTREDDNNSLKHSQPSPVNFSEDTPVFVKQENLDYPEVHFERTADQELESNYFETPKDHTGYEGLQQSIIRMSYEIAEAQGDVDQNGQDVEDQSLPHVPCKKAKLKIELLNGFSPHTRKNICSSSFSTPVYVTSTKSCLPKNQNPANHIISATGDSPCLNRCKEIGDTTYSIHTPLSTVDITSLISMAAQTANFVQSSAATPNFGQSSAATPNLKESSPLIKNLDQSPAQTPNFDQSYQTSNFDQSSSPTQNVDQSSPPIQAEGSCIISTHQDTGTILYFPVAPYLRTLVDAGVGNPIDLSVRIPVDLRGATTRVETSGAVFCGEASGTSVASEESADESASEATGERTLEAQDGLGEKTSDDLDEKTSDDLDEKTSDDLDEQTADDLDEQTADDLGEKTSDDLGEKTADDLGEKTADDLGEMTSDDTDERSSDTIDVTTPDVHGGIILESLQANVPTATPLINTTSMPAYDAIAKTISKILLGSNGQPECLVTSDLPDESQQQHSSNSLSMLDTLRTRGDDDDDTERESHNMKERRRRARIKDACDLMRQLVPGMSEKTDKATVFEFAARYIYFLKGFVGGVHDKDFLIKYSPY